MRKIRQRPLRKCAFAYCICELPHARHCPKRVWLNTTATTPVVKTEVSESENTVSTVFYKTYPSLPEIKVKLSGPCKFAGLALSLREYNVSTLHYRVNPTLMGDK
jgi:hypothetical protein